MPAEEPMPRTLLIAVGLLFAGCASEPPPSPPYAARPVVEVSRWQVWSAGDLIGHLVQFEIRDPKGPVPFYRVLDLQGRWLGHATMQGRFSRRVPFQDGEQDLGVWPLAGGTAQLLDASAPVELKPVAVEAVGRPGEAAPR
jgi:hypothetical protein